MFNGGDDISAGFEGGLGDGQVEMERTDIQGGVICTKNDQVTVLSSEIQTAHGQPEPLRQWWGWGVHRVNGLLKRKTGLCCYRFK